MEIAVSHRKRARFVLNLNKVGLFLFCVYILMSYLGNDVILPSSIGSLTMYAFLGYSVLYVFFKGNFKLRFISLWMALFMGLSLVAMLYSPEKEILGGTFYLLIVNFLLILLLSQYKITMQTVERIAWTYTLSAALLIVLLLITGNLGNFSADDERLGTELLGNANILATMLMTSALYTIWLLVYSQQKLFAKIVLLACLVAQYFGLFLSGGRKYIVIPLVFWYLLLLFKQDKKGRKHIVKYTVVIGVIAVTVWMMIMNIPMFYNTIGVRMESFLSFLEGDTADADGSSIIRAKMIQMGIEKWLENPIVGYGFDSFKYYNLAVNGRFYYSHNNFVEMLYNTGIIGLVFYYWYYVYLFRRAWKRRKKVQTKAVAFAVALVISMLIYEYGAINYTATTSMIMFYFAGIMLRFQKQADVYRKK